MTDLLAKQLFDALLEQIRKNGFTDIITFALPEASENSRFSNFNDDYVYTSTDTELQNLARLSERSDRGSYEALRRLTDAGEQYFRLVNKIPERYSATIAKLFKDEQSPPDDTIFMDRTDEPKVDLSASLARDSANQARRLMEFIREHIDEDDEDFMKDLDNFLIQLP